MAELVEYFPELKPWADSAAKGKFVLPNCGACGKSHWYPRGYCPFCYALDIRWQEACGDGIIYSFTTSPAGGNTVAYVTLQEGPTILTNIVESEFDRLRIGQAVRAVMRPDEKGVLWPKFIPAQADQRED